MRTRTRIVTGIAGLLALVGSSAAQAQAQDLRAVIPFEFTVAGKAMPAGAYTATPIFAASGAMQIRSLGGGAIVLMTPAGFGDAKEHPQLTFARYGDRYFLRTVRLSNGSEFTASRTKAEQEIVRKLAENHLPGGTIVTVAMGQ